MSTLYKAQTIGNRTAPDLHLSATAELPDVINSYEESIYLPAHYKQFDEQAGIIFSALIDSMPGGTIDALLIRLLQHRRGVFVVPYPRWVAEDSAEKTDIASILAEWLSVERTEGEKSTLLRNIASDLGLEWKVIA